MEALCRAVVEGVATTAPESRVSVFDNGWGVRKPVAHYGPVDVEFCGARLSRRVHRRESWANVRASDLLGGLGNPVVSRLRAADAVLDLSGGDSFSDIYGDYQFRFTTAPKRAAVAFRRPLVLLPQTYGPFVSERNRTTAVRVVRQVTLAFSRDDASHEVLLDMLGEQADPRYHRQGVDVAFGLTPNDPAGKLPPALRAALLDASPRRPRVGINISGLLYNDPTAAQRFGLSLDYRSVIRTLTAWLSRQEADVFLVPHVIGSAGMDAPVQDDDIRACRDVVEGLAQQGFSQVMMVPPGLDAAEMKWVIGRMDWFCGTRMHSAIAALSSGVPTCAIAYSMKTRGVFDTCGQGEEVIDARRTDEEESVRLIQDAWTRRDVVRKSLRAELEPILHRSREQLADVVQGIAFSTARRDR